MLKLHHKFQIEKNKTTIFLGPSYAAINIVSRSLCYVLTASCQDGSNSLRAHYCSGLTANDNGKYIACSVPGNVLSTFLVLY